MINIHFKKQAIDVFCMENLLLGDIIKDQGISMEMPCNCTGVCKKCTVKITKVSSGEESEALACAYYLKEDIIVETKDLNTGLAYKNNENKMTISLKPSCFKGKLPKINRSSNKPYINEIKEYKYNLNLIKKISKYEKKGVNDSLYGIFYKNEILDIVCENEESKLLGISIDLGTTGISMYLLDLENGDILGETSFLNPQFKYGNDVLTRVSFCMENRDNIYILQKAVIDKINEKIEELTKGKFSNLNIYRIFVAGNTIMQHIFAGVNPECLSKNPYRPIFDDSIDFSIKDLKINENAIITLMPSISSYVGGDIVAGIFSTNFYKKDKNILYIDIGTNGEIILKIKGQYYGTSTAAGPALEGMNISCGQRATLGAIEKAYFDDEGSIQIKTIGDKPPTGICGSGLIDLTSALLKKKIINKTGKLMDVKEKKYFINENIYLSQSDIRQVQLAKGAISTGIKMLLTEAMASYNDLDEIYIAGSFGYHLNFNNLKEIGIIDKSYNKEIYFVGNSSLEGARIALLNEDALLEMREIKSLIKPVELSTSDDFQEFFVKELSF